MYTSSTSEPGLSDAIFARPEGTSIASRRAALIDYFADRPAAGYFPRTGFIEVAARLYRGDAAATILPALDVLLEQPDGDMFWAYPMALLHCVGAERLPDEVLQRMRRLWQTYTPYRGDTENHWLLYYAALYLVSESYPDAPGTSWFNGRSSGENRVEATEYLDHWIALTTRRGQGEFDSPHYLPFFLAPLALLYGWAEDAGIRQRAAMMLDYLIADFAVDTLDGLYTGAFSRIYPAPTLERWRNGSTTFAWLLFGTCPFRPDAINVVLPRVGYRPHGTAVILAMSGYTPPEVIRRIATDRTHSYLHRERKRTRHRIRRSDVRNAPVYKTTFMTPNYAVGSLQGGLLQPIQQHSWEVLWRTEDPHEGFNVLFTVHPHYGPDELALYFPEEPKLLTEAVIQHEKSTYDKPDKWTGGSPYEQIVQHDDAVVALYQIDETAPYPHVSGYFSRTLSGLRDDVSGWIVAQGGEAMIAYYPLAPYVWQDEPGGDRRLFSPHRSNGAVVQVASASGYASLEAFASAVRALPLEVSISPRPSVRFTTLRGGTIEAVYGVTPVLDDVPIDYTAWPLFDGPFLQAAVDSRRLDLRHGTLHRRLDFSDFTIHDQPEA